MVETFFNFPGMSGPMAQALFWIGLLIVVKFWIRRSKKRQRIARTS